jgi:ABC-type multidrug transport system fused ATPase/permease subunit
MEYIRKIALFLGLKTRQQLIWLVLFSIFVSIIEVVGISAIMPFIEVAINFDNIHTNQYYQKAFDILGFDNDVRFVIFYGLLLVGFYIFRGGVNLLYSYLMADFSHGLYTQMTKKLFNTYLYMPYITFSKKNSSYLTKTIITEASLISAVIKAILLMISEGFVILFLYILMLIASWEITLVFTVILGIKILFLTKTISKKIKVVGVIRATTQARFYEIINKLFGNFKHVKLQDKTRLKKMESEFSIAVEKYAKANVSNDFLNTVPRLFLETSGFSLIVILLVVLLYYNQSNISYILPILTLFILALYRLLPSVNRIVNGYNTLMYYHASIDIVGNELNNIQENLKDGVVNFDNKIELTGVSFSYGTVEVIKGINLTINKGDRIAFVGESGSGKSTLIDLIIGLYRPNLGEIRVGGDTLDESNLQNWRSQIGYIPQQIYLFDGTVKENVCFGRKFDKALMREVLKQANIFNFLEAKHGMDTLVGEGGIQLSGGQKQRIAIARALYGRPEILVLDEATSALDDETEQKIMNEIYQISQDKTLIIVAHRLGTIKGCDKVYEIKNGTIR